MKHLVLAAIALVLTASWIAGAQGRATVAVGAARIDITPRGPIHLVGYANRSGETSEVAQPLHARALALGGDGAPTVVLIVAEVCGVTPELSSAVADALQRRHGISRAQVAVCATHTHTGPAIDGLLPYSFGRDFPADQLARTRAYTAWLREQLIAVADSAFRDRRLASLAWAEGAVGFAVQRRRIENGRWAGFGEVPGGPVDHALPVLRVADAEGRIRAVFTSYACHCTAVGGMNAIHPDWAGAAAATLESEYPGAVALVGIGCGADAGPIPKGGIDAADRNGAAVAAEVNRLLGGPLRPLGAVTRTSFRQVDLPLDRVVSRDELRERAQSRPRLEAYAAGRLLQTLESGGPLPAVVPLPIQVWAFGDGLSMVFLGGEVVSEYSLRLRRELDRRRLWVNAYANAVPCYIPSRRMYAEGGYEVDSSIVKYGWPTRLGIETEDRIVAAVHELVPAEFRRTPGATRP